MADEISRKTLLILLVTAIIVSAIGTWIVIDASLDVGNSAYNSKTGANLRFDVLGSDPAPIPVRSSGIVGLTILDK